MSDNIVQATYPDKPRRGLPGNRANSTGEPGSTFIAVGDDIPFGRAVSKDEDSDKGCTLGGTDFIGISGADPSKDGLALSTALQGGSSQSDKAVEGDNVNVQSFGDFFVLPGADVDPTKVVAYAPATGIFGPHNGTYTEVVEGAKYRETVTLASGEVVAVRLSKPQGNDLPAST